MRTGQTFPLKLTVTDEESNRTVVNMKVVVLVPQNHRFRWPKTTQKRFHL